MKIFEFGRVDILRNAEGGAGGGGDAPAADPAVSPESLLFPDENGDEKPAGGGEGNHPEGDENQGDEGKKDEEGNQSEDGDKVPDDGKYDLKMPEGIELDAELAEALGPEFQDLGLTNAQAQKLVDKYIEINQARAEKKQEEWGDIISKWQDEVRADKEIGGVNFETSVKSARNVLDRFGTPELREYLEVSGGGNHPELIRVFAKVGKLIQEDRPTVGGAEGRGKPAEPAHVLFPNDAPKGN